MKNTAENRKLISEVLKAAKCAVDNGYGNVRFVMKKEDTNDKQAK